MSTTKMSKSLTKEIECGRVPCGSTGLKSKSTFYRIGNFPKIHVFLDLP